MNCNSCGTKISTFSTKIDPLRLTKCARVAFVNEISDELRGKERKGKQRKEGKERGTEGKRRDPGRIEDPRGKETNDQRTRKGDERGGEGDRDREQLRLVSFLRASSCTCSSAKARALARQPRARACGSVLRKGPELVVTMSTRDLKSEIEDRRTGGRRRRRGKERNDHETTKREQKRETAEKDEKRSNTAGHHRYLSRDHVFEKP